MIHMAEMQLSPATQQLLMQMQTFQEQYQSIMIQKEAMKAQTIELDRALEELAKTKDGEEVYKAVGPILVKSTKTELVKEMKEKNEMIDVRLKSLDKQEEKLKEKLKEIQEKIQSSIGSMQKGKQEREASEEKEFG